MRFLNLMIVVFVCQAQYPTPYLYFHVQRPHLESTSLNLFAGNAQPLREPELPSLHCRANQFVPTKYIPAVHSFTGTTISLPERPHLESTSLNLMAGNAQPLREPELSSLHSQADQFVPTNCIPAVPSFTGTTISLPELVKSEHYSNFQSVPQTTSSTAISSVPTTYSQPTLPRGPMPNMFTYPDVSQGIAFMQPSASLQSAGMKWIHKVPQYRSSMPLNARPKSLPVGSSYGSSTNCSRALLHNPLNVDAGMPVGYEEALRSQYKGWIPIQQDGNSSMLLQPATFLDRMGIPKPAVPIRSFYGIQEHGHQGSSILRQAQHPPQMGMTGYASLYHTQQLGGISHEPQQLFPTVQKNMNGSQGQSSHQSCQHWQHFC